MSTETDVLAAAAELVAAFGAHDREDYFARFAPDAAFLFYTAPRRLDTRAEYEDLWGRWERESGFHVHGCRSANGRVQVLGDTAVFMHDVETRVEMDGATETVFERETIVFARRDGTWLAVHEHLSPKP